MTNRLLLICALQAMLVGCAGGPDDAPLDPANEELKAATFECGETRCKVGKQLCEIRSGGAHLPTGGSSQSASCKTLPDVGRCREAPSCSTCFADSGGTGRMCSAAGANLTVHLLMP